MVPLPSSAGMVCLECNDVIKTLKRHNAKTHYSKHASKYDDLPQERRKELINAMQQNRQAQQSMLRKPTDENQRSVLAGFRIAHILNKHGKQ